ncbi:MAG: dihydrofolate reductase, partial [Alphaproteobacteria bacterium]|nr:dihydrofolate reductase [Alphaproteobacteria bacterium]
MPNSPPAQVRIEIVVAAARNRVIGRQGGMPWQMPSDLRTFRRLTMGHPIVMGRRTFQAIGRPLDGRTNIVVTRDTGFNAEGIITARSLDEAIAHAAAAPNLDDRVMIIGGGEIYQAALPLADTVHLTEIGAEPAGDTYFPELSVH